MKKNSTAIYRTLLRESLTLAWQRKTLWIFGIFAAIVSTGGVFDVATAGMRRVQLGGTFTHQFISSCFAGYSMFGSFLSRAQTLGPTHGIAALFFIILICVGGIFLAVLSQTALIHGIKSPTHEHPNVIRKRAHDHIARIFTLDVLTKLAGAVAIAIATIPFLWQGPVSDNTFLLLACIQLVIFFPLVLVINILSFLAIIHIIETEATISEALSVAWNIFARHWLATFEYAILLFLLIALSGFVLLAIILFLTVPYALIYSASLLTGSFIIFVVANALFGLVALAIILAFGGAVITFQYSAWYLFYKQTGLPLHARLPIAKTFRLFGIK